MSSHPYGLRGDPFIPPATLNAKDASRLIRRRVRAFNGDGGALFPIPTCDLIHELTGGVPDAMLVLAGHAMRLAAAEDAPAVMPAHVRKAAAAEEQAAAAREAAGATADPAPAADAPAGPDATRAARAAQAIDVLLRDEGEPAVEPAAAVARAVDPADDDEDAVAEAPEVEDEGIEATADADDDEDLPPFRPASISLPTAPSENLDQDAREWVSRFISAAGAPPPPPEPARRGRSRRSRKVTRSIPAEPIPATPEPRPEPLAEALPALLRAAPAPRRGSRARAGWRHRRSNGGNLLFALAAVAIVAFVVRQSMRQDLAPPASAPGRPAPTSAPIAEPSPSRPGKVRAVPAPAVSEPPAIRPEPSPPAAAGGKRLHQAPDPTTSPAVSANEAPRRERPSGRYGLEVATFIFEERARVERERLLAAGLRARLVTTVEYGSRVYRVVLGGYPHPAAAERAADSLLSNGVVLQARVVTVTSSR